MHQLPENWLLYGVCGGLGAFISQIANDNCIDLCKLKNGKFYLGTLGGVFIGCVAGIIADSNPINALIGGFAGLSFIEKVVTARAKGIESIICKDKTNKENDNKNS